MCYLGSKYHRNGVVAVGSVPALAGVGYSTSQVPGWIGGRFMVRMEGQKSEQRKGMEARQEGYQGGGRAAKGKRDRERR